jgi:hypothetical protein
VDASLGGAPREPSPAPSPAPSPSRSPEAAASPAGSFEFGPRVRVLTDDGVHWTAHATDAGVLAVTLTPDLAELAARLYLEARGGGRLAVRDAEGRWALAQVSDLTEPVGVVEDAGA